MQILQYIRNVKAENAEMNETNPIETLPNGLTADQVKKAREIFDQVPITKVCKGVGVNISTVYRVLSGESYQFDKFTKVLIASKKQIAKTKKTAKQLPI
jgi:DNA invertase Pin-like site-specific DNA recombinase